MKTLTTYDKIFLGCVAVLVCVLGFYLGNMIYKWIEQQWIYKRYYISVCDKNGVPAGWAHIERSKSIMEYEEIIAIQNRIRKDRNNSDLTITGISKLD